MATLVTGSFHQHTGIRAGQQGTGTQATYTATGITPWEAFKAECGGDESSVQYFRIHGRDAAGTAADLNIANAYITFSMQTGFTPASSVQFFMAGDLSGTAIKCMLALNADRKIEFYDSTTDYGTPAIGSPISTSSFALTEDATYYCYLHVPTTTSGNGTLEVYTRGESGLYIQHGSMTLTGNFLASNNTRFTFGPAINFNSNTGIDFKFGGVSVFSDEFPASFPQTYEALPTGNGTLNASTWGPSTGTNKWEVVDERPVVETDYLIATAASAGDAYTATLQTRAQAGITTDGILAVAPFVQTWDQDGSNNAQFQTVFYSGSTRTDTNSYTPGTAALSHARGTFFATDPATTAAWTDAAVDSLQTGAEYIAGAGNAIAGIGAIVWYFPGVAESSSVGVGRGTIAVDRRRRFRVSF